MLFVPDTAGVGIGAAVLSEWEQCMPWSSNHPLYSWVEAGTGEYLRWNSLLQGSCLLWLCLEQFWGVLLQILKGTNSWNSTDFGVPSLSFPLSTPAARGTKARCTGSMVPRGTAAGEFWKHKLIAKFTSCVMAMLTVLTAFAVQHLRGSRKGLRAQPGRMRSCKFRWALADIVPHCLYRAHFLLHSSTLATHPPHRHKHTNTHKYPSKKITVTSSYNFT